MGLDPRIKLTVAVTLPLSYIPSQLPMEAVHARMELRVPSTHPALQPSKLALGTRNTTLNLELRNPAMWSRADSGEPEEDPPPPGESPTSCISEEEKQKRSINDCVGRKDLEDLYR